MNREIVGMFSRTLNTLSQNELKAFKCTLEMINETKRKENATAVEAC
ncbi:hypothetical protein GCM10023261_03920 [Bartonella jaculi]|uniref:MarR family transcriptional regulator n=1 Tax=Bartonella jaculi TaxID=686226 RepID=A0ABP9MZ08_9HYPH